MPSFRTKTIESILEPVAQQISQLVLFEDLASKGYKIPDITPAVDAVNNAVNNFAKAAQDTMDHSDDLILKENMPPVVEQVVFATKNLKEAARILKENSGCLNGLTLLTDGARKLLIGTSNLMLIFDDSEIRKLVTCLKSFRNYLIQLEDLRTKPALLNFGRTFKDLLVTLNPQIEKRTNDLISRKQFNIINNNLNMINENVLKLMTASRMLINHYEKHDESNEKTRKMQHILNNEIYWQVERIETIISALQTELDDVENFNSVLFGSDLLNGSENILGDPLHWLYNICKSGQELSFPWLKDYKKMPETIGHIATREILNNLLIAGDFINGEESKILKDATSTLMDILHDTAILRYNGEGGGQHERQLSYNLEEGIDKLIKIFKIICDNHQQNLSNTPIKHSNTSKGLLVEIFNWINNERTQTGRDIDQEFIENGRNLFRNFIVSLTNISNLTHNRKLKDHFNELVDSVDKSCITIYSLQKNCKFDEEYRKILNKLIETVNKCSLMLLSSYNLLSNKLVKVKCNLQSVIVKKDEEKLENSLKKFKSFNYNLQNMIIAIFEFLNADPILKNEINNKIKEIMRESASVVEITTILKESDDCVSKEYFHQVLDHWFKSTQHAMTLISSLFSTSDLIDDNYNSMEIYIQNIQKSLNHNEPKNVVSYATKVSGVANGTSIIIENEIGNTSVETIKSSLIKVKQLIDSEKLDQAIEKYDQNPNEKQNQLEIINEAINIKKAMIHVKQSLLPLDVKPKFIEASLMEFNKDESKNTKKEDITTKTMTPEEHHILMNTSTSNRIAIAAIDLHKEASKWDASSNDLIAAAKKMALLFAVISKFADETDETKNLPSKKELIDITKQIIDTALEVVKYANKIAIDCPNKRNKTNLVASNEKLPTIATQLKILATVKATLYGRKNDKEDIEATKVLISCAESLMEGVKTVVNDAEAASVRPKNSSYKNECQWKRL